ETAAGFRSPRSTDVTRSAFTRTAPGTTTPTGVTRFPAVCMAHRLRIAKPSRGQKFTSNQATCSPGSVDVIPFTPAPLVVTGSPFIRRDVSGRYISLADGRRRAAPSPARQDRGEGGGDDEPAFRDPRVRCPRSAPRISDAWLCAAQTTQYVAGCVPRVQLRNALPLPQDAGRERLVDRGTGAHHRGRPRRSAHGPSRQDRLPVDGGGEGALRTAPLPDGARRVRGRDLRRALRLPRPDVPRRAHARARGPPQSAGGAPGEDARLPGADQRAPRRLHTRAPAPRDGVRGARSALAE